MKLKFNRISRAAIEAILINVIIIHICLCRKDSDIVKPYGKWVYYDAQIKQIPHDRNYALNKTKKVAWFVSNCEANNSRMEYAYELQNYIQVSLTKTDYLRKAI